MTRSHAQRRTLTISYHQVTFYDPSDPSVNWPTRPTHVTHDDQWLMAPWLLSAFKVPPGPVSIGMGDHLRTGIPFGYVTSQLGQLSLPSLRGRFITYQLRLG